jgi:hypothetical protein
VVPVAKRRVLAFAAATEVDRLALLDLHRFAAISNLELLSFDTDRTVLGDMDREGF